MIDPQQLNGRDLVLTSVQLHYLQRVMRLQTGDKFQAIDGVGSLYLVELATPAAQVLAQSRPVGVELPVAVNLVVAVPKSGLDDIVRACTELGVSAIYPVTSDRTIVQPSAQKQRRWNEIAKEATEQSERLLVPSIYPVLSWSTVMTQITGQRKICTARGNSPHLIGCLDANLPVSIAIGPASFGANGDRHWPRRRLGRSRAPAGD